MIHRLVFFVIVCMTPPALANTLVFGTPVDHGACTGASGSVGCTRSASLGASGTSSAEAIIRAQASAKHTTLESAASVQNVVEYEIPYTITRDVTVIPDPDGPGPGLARLEYPIIDLEVDILNHGYVGVNDASPSSFQSAAFEAGAVTSFATTQNLECLRNGIVGPPGGVSVSGVGAETIQYADFADGDLDNTCRIGERDELLVSAGEISMEAEIPSLFAVWEDFDEPFALDYGSPHTFTQTYSNVLTVSFVLKAESRPSGSISIEGGPAVGCVGLNPTASGVTIPGGCPGALTIQARTVVYDTRTEDVSAVPEPGLVALGAAAVVALTRLVQRRREHRS